MGAGERRRDIDVTVFEAILGVGSAVAIHSSVGASRKGKDRRGLAGLLTGEAALKVVARRTDTLRCMRTKIDDQVVVVATVDRSRASLARIVGLWALIDNVIRVEAAGDVAGMACVVALTDVDSHLADVGNAVEEKRRLCSAALLQEVAVLLSEDLRPQRQ